MAIQLDPAPPNPTAVASASTSTSTGPDPVFTPAHTFEAHTRAVTALGLAPDGRTLVSAGADGWVHVWDARAGSHLRSTRCHRTGINDISISPDGLYLATAADDGTALVFALAAGFDDAGPLRALEGHTAPVLSVAFSPTASLVATGSFDESVIIWDVLGARALHTIPAHADAVWSVGWDAEGALVITGSADGLIRLWDANTGQCLRTLDNESNAPVSHASFTPSSFFLLSSTLSSSILIYSLHNSKVLKTLRAQEYVAEKYPSPALVFPRPPRAARLANGAGGHGAGGRGAGEFGEPGVGAGGEARGKARPGALVVAGSENGKAVVWDLNDRRVVAALDAGDGPVLAVAVGEGVLATAGVDRRVRIWTFGGGSDGAEGGEGGKGGDGGEGVRERS